MTFILKATHLGNLCHLNSFSIPNQDMIFFALRGCFPVDANDHSFQSEHALRRVPVNYRAPRCTFIQWLPEKAEMAVFPGSTVPYVDEVGKAKRKGEKGANQMMTGYYQQGYERGRHFGSVVHDAFLQVGKMAVRRSADDLDYDTADRVEVSGPAPLWDNLHCGRCESSDEAPFFASAGCQVIAGFPDADGYIESGPWKIFKQTADGRSHQKQFPYVLLSANSAYALTANNNKTAAPRLRYGSTGPLVKVLQQALKTQGFYQKSLDGDFGEGTLRAVLSAQRQKLGADQADGIVGPLSANELGIEWPDITLAA